MRVLMSIVVLVWIFSFLRSLFKKRRSINVQLLISMMLFGGIGFAAGNYYLDSGWATFGAVFGALVGIELKEKLYQGIYMIYEDILEK